MKVEGKVKKGTLSAKIEGRIDLESSQELEKFLDDNLEGATAAEFDFRKVEYISSAGLRVLLKLSKRFGGEKDRVTVSHVNDTVRSVFELTGFDEMFVLK